MNIFSWYILVVELLGQFGQLLKTHLANQILSFKVYSFGRCGVWQNLAVRLSESRNMLVVKVFQCCFKSCFQKSKPSILQYHITSLKTFLNLFPVPDTHAFFGSISNPFHLCRLSVTQLNCSQLSEWSLTKHLSKVFTGYYK